MKRDFDLTSTILLELESRQFDNEYKSLSIEREAKNKVMKHLKLLHEEGFIEAEDMSSLQDIYILPGILT